MKRPIDSVQNALAYQLQGLRDTETRLKEELAVSTHQITSTELQAEMHRYSEDADNKLQKIDRILNTFATC